MVVDADRTYPMLPLKNWRDLRAQFRRTLPRQVTADYVETTLGVSKRAALNTIGRLRTLGLIDDTGKPTDMAQD